MAWKFWTPLIRNRWCIRNLKTWLQSFIENLNIWVTQDALFMNCSSLVRTPGLEPTRLGPPWMGLSVPNASYLDWIRNIISKGSGSALKYPLFVKNHIFLTVLPLPMFKCIDSIKQSLLTTVISILFSVQLHKKCDFD